MSKNGACKYLYWTIVGIIILTYIFTYLYIPPTGDDLGFISSFNEQNDTWLAFPRFMYRHWIWGNARMADMLNPIAFYFLPLWASAILNGIVTGSMFVLTCRIAVLINKSDIRYFLYIIVSALILFTFRWDALWMEWCTSFNYVWASSFALGALIIILSKRTDSGAWHWWISIPFCFVAAAMHEASGLPLAIGLVIYSITSGFFRERNIVGRLNITAFVLGGIFTLTSPASYMRVGSMLQPESPVGMIIFSDFYTVILLIIALYLWVFNRHMLDRLFQSQWIIFFAAALVSTGFMLLSKYGGRTGWFAQLYAIIAIFQILSKIKINYNRIFRNTISIVLTVISVFHCVALMIWQKRLGTETQNVITKYIESPTGIVFCDYTTDTETPWYLLRKTHGVPDSDDTYYRYRMSRHYGSGKQIVILPEEIQSILANMPDTMVRVGNTLISTTPLPTYEDKIVEIFPRRMAKIEGVEYVENRFERESKFLYFYSPVDRDRGEK